jgi:hypothetical protein
MPERLADAVDELAQPNRPHRQEEPQIQADPALRRTRLMRNAPAAVVAVIVLGGAAAATGPQSNPSKATIPRCLTPRPWPPNLAGEE